MDYSVLTIDAALALGISVTLCAVAIWLSRTKFRALVRHGDLNAVQRAHTTPTSRVGGVAILAAFLIASGFALPNGGSLWWVLPVSVAPLFLSGLAEDLGMHVTPLGRLSAALLSCAIAVLLTGDWMRDTGVDLLNPLLAWGPLAVLITVFTAAAISHAFNLIDGLNGLAGFTGLLASLGIAAIATEVGSNEIAALSLLLAAATSGFLLLNFPSGKIFLGDAGAYTLGFLLAWLGIALANRSPDVTPLAVMLILFWPLADALLAIYRRHRHHRPVSHADRLHFHQLVMRGLEICVLGRGHRDLANPLATVLLLPLIATPVMLGVWLHAQPVAAFVALVACFVAFFGIYTLGMRLAVRRAKPSTGAQPVSLT